MTTATNKTGSFIAALSTGAAMMALLSPAAAQSSEPKTSWGATAAFASLPRGKVYQISNETPKIDGVQCRTTGTAHTVVEYNNNTIVRTQTTGVRANLTKTCTYIVSPEQIPFIREEIASMNDFSVEKPLLKTNDQQTDPTTGIFTIQGALYNKLTLIAPRDAAIHNQQGAFGNCRPTLPGGAGAPLVLNEKRQPVRDAFGQYVRDLPSSQIPAGKPNLQITCRWSGPAYLAAK